MFGRSVLNFDDFIRNGSANLVKINSVGNIFKEGQLGKQLN